MPFNSPSDTGYYPQNLQDNNYNTTSVAPPNSNNIGALNNVGNSPGQGRLMIPQGANAGFVKGFMDMQNNVQENDRRNAITNINIGKYNMLQSEWNRQQQLQQGMSTAAQDGGYEGVIAYLEKADPDRAIEFTKAKLGLDRAIMQNDVMKSAAEYQKNDIMLQSYGILGRMGATLLQAPAKDRNAMYQQMLPIAKAVNPDAPDTLNNDAVSMFMLAASQADPKSQLFGAQKASLSAQSALGKLGADIEDRMKAGHTIETDPVLRTMVGQMNKYQNDSATADARLTNIQLQNGRLEQQGNIQSAQAIQGATNQVTQNLAKSSKDNMNFFDNALATSSTLETLLKDPSNAAYQAQLGLQFATMYQKGALSDRDVMVQYSTMGLPALGKKVQGMMQGKPINLNPDEVKNIANGFYDMTNNRLGYQKQIESTYKDATSKQGSLVDWNSVIKPSETFEKIKAQNIDLVNAASNGQIPVDIQAMADRAVKEGRMTPDQAQAAARAMMLDKLRQKQVNDTPTVTPTAPDENNATIDPATQDLMSQVQQNQQQIDANQQVLDNAQNQLDSQSGYQMQ